MSIEVGKFYRHFKGGLYQVLNIAIHSESSEKLVIYQALYGTFEVYARPLVNFEELLSPEKYPNSVQKHRFEEISKEELAAAYGKELQNQVSAKFGKKNNEDSSSYNFDKSSTATVNDSEAYKEAIAAGVSPILLQFLDAENSEKKLDVIKANYMDIDEKTLTSIEVSLDIYSSEGTVDDRIAYICDNLRTKAKYENTRLR